MQFYTLINLVKNIFKCHLFINLKLSKKNTSINYILSSK